MSRKDLYDNLEIEQVRRGQRGLRPMSALGGAVDGFEEGFLAVKKYQADKKRDQQADEDRREKKRDEAFERQRNDDAYKEWRKTQGKTGGLKTREEFNREYDAANPPEKEKKSLLEKGVDWASEKFAETWKTFGFKEDVRKEGGEDGVSLEQPSVGGMQPEEMADGGLSKGRGILRAAEGTLGGVGVAAEEQVADSPAPDIARKPPVEQVPSKKPVTSPSPYEQLAEKNPKAAEFIRQIGQDPSANLKQITDESQLAAMLEFTSKRPDFGKISEYTGVIKRAKDEGVFRMLQQLEMGTKDKAIAADTKKKAIEYFNSMGEEGGLVDVEAVPMTYKAPSGETLSYNRWRMKMDDGTTGLIDTRDLLMQVLSVKGLISQENQWTKDKFTREQIEEGKKDRAQRQSEQKDARRENDFRRNSQSIDALFEKEADAMLKVLPKPSNNVIAAIYGNNAGEEARKEMIGGLVRQTIADLRNTDDYRNLNDEATFKSFRSRLTTDFKERYKQNEQKLLDDRANQLGDLFVDANARGSTQAMNEFVRDNLAGLRMLVGKDILSAKDLKPGTAARAKLESFAVRANPKTKDEGGN